MLRIDSLSKSYGEQKVLDRINLTVKENEIAIVTGKSGMGKTTLLLCILGFVRPDSGSILLDGKRIDGLPIEKRGLAYVPQDYGLFTHMTVSENIAFGLAVRGESQEVIGQRVSELLKTVELPSGLAARAVTDLSGGEKQRVAVARALAIKPSLFLLDEPLSAIDVETKQAIGRQLRSIIKRLRIPTIVVSHDPADAKTLGDVTYRLESGKLRKM